MTRVDLWLKGAMALASPACIANVILLGPTEAKRRAMASWHVLSPFKRLPIKHLSEVCEHHELFLRIPHAMPGHWGSLSPYEKLCLASLVASRHPKQVFEIGTFDGESTHLMAINAPNAEIWTLDLPPTPSDTAFETTELDLALIHHRKTGVAFADTAEAERIHQLLGDSATFDFGRVPASIDFAFIDGAHSFRYVRNDTEKLMSMMSPEGVIVWHDYGEYCAGVRRYLNRFKHVGAFSICHTSLAVVTLDRELRARLLGGDTGE